MSYSLEDDIQYAIDNGLAKKDKWIAKAILPGASEMLRLLLAGVVVEHKQNVIVHAATPDDSDVSIAECGTRFRRYFKVDGTLGSMPIKCGKCDTCHQEKGMRDKLRIASNVVRRLKENDKLKLRYKSGVPASEAQAFQKRLQRDETAEYHRSLNENGDYDFFIQSESDSAAFGDEIELKTASTEQGFCETYDLDQVHNFKQAVKIHQEAGKRQSGKLFKKIDKHEEEESTLIRLPALQTVHKKDDRRLEQVMRRIKPLNYVDDTQQLQHEIYNMAGLTHAECNRRNIPVKVTMLFRYTTGADLERFNENVAYNQFLDGKCPNKKHKEAQGSYGSYLDIPAQKATQGALL